MIISRILALIIWLPTLPYSFLNYPAYLCHIFLRQFNAMLILRVFVLIIRHANLPYYCLNYPACYFSVFLP